MAAMRRRDYQAAWAISDGVLASRDPATRDDPAQPYHQRWVWDGRDPDGRDVLVRCYHGLGDTLQFARYLPALRQRARSLTLEVQPELLRLFEAVPGADRVVPFDPARPAPPPACASACDIEIMELAHVLRLPPEAVAPLALRAEPVRLPPGSIGLCWRSGNWDPARSIPLGLVRPALGARPALSLCPGEYPADHGGWTFAGPDGCPGAIEQTASLIAGLGLVVSVDTMVAHLAGALRRPTVLLLRCEADWRWGDRAETDWYPSMRLIRQPRPGDWDSVASALEGVISRSGRRGQG